MNNLMIKLSAEELSDPCVRVIKIHRFDRDFELIIKSVANFSLVIGVNGYKTKGLTVSAESIVDLQSFQLLSSDMDQLLNDFMSIEETESEE